MAEKTQASKGASGDDAIALLTDDHKKVKKMFPQAKKAKLDTKALGAQIKQRKEQLKAEIERQ